MNSLSINVSHLNLPPKIQYPAAIIYFVVAPNCWGKNERKVRIDREVF
jgi:hypothetical protein